MATLVQFLAAGVNGAASGTATFFLRGTASSAQSVMYNEFEGLTQPASNVVTLDANGAAEVYVDAYVDVELKNSAGTTLRTVTVGNSAPLVEVQSTSFTGTDYDGSPANTIGEPITLKAILDKWITSAGASNWQALVDGSPVNIQAALASFAGMFVNVKDPTYGALGDGVTDDTTAILAATAAANGGIVFFPAGTYKVTTLSLGDVNLNWLGSGAGASIVSGTTSTNLIALTDNTNTGWKNFSGLSFASSGAYTRLFELEASQNITFSRCNFDASQCSAEALEFTSAAGYSKLYFNNCDFVLGASTGFGFQNNAAAGERLISITDCNFTVPSGFTGSILRGPDMQVQGCNFDASLVTSGAYYHVDAASGTVAGSYVGVFVGNVFYDGGSAGFAFKLTGLSSGCDFTEEGNSFSGFVVPTLTAEKGHIYEITDAESGFPGKVHLGSRKGRTLYFTSITDEFVASACLVADQLVISQDPDEDPFEVTVPALIPGLTGTIIVFPSSTGGDGVINCQFLDSEGRSGYIDFTDGTAVGADATVLNNPASCGYLTTCNAAGTFRSCILGQYSHWIAV